MAEDGKDIPAIDADMAAILRACGVGLPQDHEDDEYKKLRQSVDAFAAKMADKLIDKSAEGYHGWDDCAYRSAIERKLFEHTARLLGGDTGQAVDVANLAMFLSRMPTRPERRVAAAPWRIPFRPDCPEPPVGMSWEQYKRLSGRRVTDWREP